MATTRRAHKAPPAAAHGLGPGPRILKKYPNRRLYDTEISSYITLADVKTMVLSNRSFEVRDAKTGENLTRAILLQIILEEETGGMPIFSSAMLSQIIRFYGHAMQGMMGSYLEKNLQTFTDIQGSSRRAVDRFVRRGRRGWIGRSEAAEPRDVDAVPQRPGAGSSGADGQLPRAVAPGVRADAGADGQADGFALPRGATEGCPTQALSAR